MAGNFERLNDALFAQVDKLQSIDPENKEQLEYCIEQSRTISQLAGNIIANANSEISPLKYMSAEGINLSEGLAPRMITGGK